MLNVVCSCCVVTGQWCGCFIDLLSLDHDRKTMIVAGVKIVEYSRVLFGKVVTFLSSIIVLV